MPLSVTVPVTPLCAHVSPPTVVVAGKPLTGCTFVAFSVCSAAARELASTADALAAPPGLGAVASAVLAPSLAAAEQTLKATNVQPERSQAPQMRLHLIPVVLPAHLRCLRPLWLRLSRRSQ